MLSSIVVPSWLNATIRPQSVPAMISSWASESTSITATDPRAPWKPGTVKNFWFGPNTGVES